MNQLPTLFCRGKNKELRQWRAWASGDVVHTEHGLVGGKLSVSSRRCTAKSVGTAGATTPEQQAEREALAEHQFMLKRRYSLTVEGAGTERFEPMKAKDFKKISDRARAQIRYPVDVQPKLDGMRGLSRQASPGPGAEIVAKSGLPFWSPYIQDELAAKIPGGAALDGEFYIHGTPLQEIISLVKRPKEKDGMFRPRLRDLEYWVFDLPEHPELVTGEWHERRDLLRRIFDGEKRSGHLVLVPSIVCHDQAAVMATQERFIQMGFEGAMLRTQDGLYEFGHRSGSLLKVKTFQDAEFRVTGYHQGEGAAEGCVIWECVTDKGKEFSVSPVGELEQRRAWMRDAESYVGRMLTVRYANLTPDGIPFHPTGKCFRPVEDLDLVADEDQGDDDRD